MTFEQWAWGRGFSLPQMDVAKMAWEAALKAQVGEPCPLCHAREVLVTTEIVGRQIDDLLNPTTERRVFEWQGERKIAEHEYITTAFNYPEAPIGSRDWTLFWQGWQAALNAAPAKGEA